MMRGILNHIVLINAEKERIVTVLSLINCNVAQKKVILPMVEISKKIFGAVSLYQVNFLYAAAEVRMSHLQVNDELIARVALPYFPPGTLSERRIELPSEMKVECTTNMQYLNQYYFIREHVYRNDLQVKTFSGEEDAIDRRSHLIVARMGHFCIGGLRLTISKPQDRQKLALERGSFDIHEHLPGLRDISYSDVSKVAILPQYRDSLAIHKMLDMAADIALKNDCRYIFGASPPAVARLFQRTFRHLGYREELRPEIPMPTGPENKHLHLIFQILHLRED